MIKINEEIVYLIPAKNIGGISSSPSFISIQEDDHRIVIKKA